MNKRVCYRFSTVASVFIFILLLKALSKLTTATLLISGKVIIFMGAFFELKPSIGNSL